MLPYSEAHMIDYTYSDLSEAEIQQHMKLKQREAEADKRKERIRWEKAKSFRFTGGMC